ncbi:hypothetical protein GCM10028803_22060 [Larkinella knui]|uniref:POTRA domain-containing protein n=1 Tax=Larkinella knui TaxID=2025310 RepID=A0A3P1CW29_9BACT|nr:M56 family metallopeptidase [Larkinella knui]RRB17280.1 hypothetical protein EHT87_03080 [Larkinella knui]
MRTDFFLYLAQSTLTVSIFALVYRLFFCRLTHFQWNRVYLVGSLLLSLVIPLFPLPELVGPDAVSEAAPRLNRVLSGLPTDAFRTGAQTDPAAFPGEFSGFILLAVYLVGCLYKTGRFCQNLKAIFKLIRTSRKRESGSYYSVYGQSDLPTFSFLRYVFLHAGNRSLAEEEQNLILEHELVHVRQRHTIDLLFFEITGILFWFNPLMAYLKFSIRQVHEYIVDQSMTRDRSHVKTYGYLLLKLTTQMAAAPLLNTFSNRSVFQRIQMFTQTPSSPMKKLTFLIILPFLALTIVLCSFFQPTATRQSRHLKAEKPVKGTPIGRIRWKGNTVHSTDELNKALGVRKGDLYDKEDFKKRLFSVVGPTVTSLYMDQGYLFFNIDVNEKRVGPVVDLELTVFEGKPVSIGNVTVKGSRKVARKTILDLIAIRSGDLFSSSKLIRSQRALAESGYFNPKEIGINPVPAADGKTVDLEYVVVEK